MNEYTELAAVLLEQDPSEVEDWNEVQELFEAKYGVAIGEIEDLLNDLLALTIPQEAPLSKALFQFFGKEEPAGTWTAILKRPYKPTVKAQSK